MHVSVYSGHGVHVSEHVFIRHTWISLILKTLEQMTFALGKIALCPM